MVHISRRIVSNLFDPSSGWRPPGCGSSWNRYEKLPYILIRNMDIPSLVFSKYFRLQAESKRETMWLSQYHSPTSVGSLHQTGGASLRLPSYLAPPLQRGRGQVEAGVPEAATCLAFIAIAGGQSGEVISGHRGRAISGPQQAGDVVSGQRHNGRSPTMRPAPRRRSGTVPSRNRPRTCHETRVRPNKPSRDARSTTTMTLQSPIPPQVPSRVQRSTRHGPRARPRTRS